MSRTYNILYVEDDPMSASLMKELMAEFPEYELVVRGTAEAGLEYIERNALDVVVFDINLPGMDGIEAIGIVRGQAHTQTLPAIALSADALPENIAKGLQAGFNHYLTKPIDIVVFIDTLTAVLEADQD